MYLTDVEPRDFLGADALSYSELSTVAQCENRWALQYNGPRIERAQSQAMALGSEVHGMWAQWWRTGAVAKSDNETATWIMNRYNEHYRPDRLNYMLLDPELPFVVEYPPGSYVFGFLDGIVAVKREAQWDLWVAECKTMGRWDKLKQLPVDMQVSIYQWAAQQSGYPVKGVMYDALLTKKWVKDRPVAESFERRWITRTPEQIQRALDELRSVIQVRKQIRSGARIPIRNIGSSCDWCPVMADCYGLTIELVDESFDPTTQGAIEWQTPLSLKS